MKKHATINAAIVGGLTGSELMPTLRQERRAILAGWRDRKNREIEGSAGVWDETAEQWAIRRIYRMVRALRASDELQVLAEFVVKLSRLNGETQAFLDQPHKLALNIVMGGTPENDPFVVMTRQRRFLLGEAMAYADTHNVSPRHVNGFIKLAGLDVTP